MPTGDVRMRGFPSRLEVAAVLQEEAPEALPGHARLGVRELVPPGRHVGRRGEDIQPGTVVLHAGRVLRPQDLGVRASLGATPVSVVRRPTVALIVTGDELLPCGSRPEGYRIVDSNSVMLDALARRDGGLPGAARMIPDRRETVRDDMAGATEDVVLVSGG